jgi:four helix bundle protein
VFPYENLEVYKRAYSANQQIYRFLKGNKNIPAFMRDQLGRASLSIMLNIAEGSAKFSSRDRKNFYVTARGSAFECAALITFILGEGEITEVLAKDLSAAFEEISRMLFTMIKNLEETLQAPSNPQ